MGWPVGSIRPPQASGIDGIPSTTIPIIDLKERVIGLCAGRPDDASWDALHVRVANKVDEARDQMQFSSKDVFHRRCDDPSKAVGDSFGGGQKESYFISLKPHTNDGLQVPGTLIQTATNAAIFASLLSSTDIIRIAGFSSGESDILEV